ncbi:microtubule-associated protein futsch-like isoform X3 [Ruditapes philippinarum]|uniref:microtubule-associated protein futsch-like isoform X3 n=1 Tax=Ruditapes philippinarum TaxID=129788 RepID=UPI00295B742C|nr:microtubule-associated protein futsch-like isoform X3 [Ruditapes philippinarum]
MSMFTLVLFGNRNQPPCLVTALYHVFVSSFLFIVCLCLWIYIFSVHVCDWSLVQILNFLVNMGNEGSLPSDTESQVSDWQSIYSYGSRAGRRSSLGSMRIPSPMDPPEPDLSHLSPDEVAKIREVIGRAKEMKDEENKRIRKLEEEYVAYTADVERRTNEVVASAGELNKDSPLCPICLESELKIQEGKMTEGQNVCADCGNLTCLKCGEMEQSVTSKEMEWVCHVCHKRRQLVLSSGLWHPGCDVDEDIPLAREVDRRLHELDKASIARGPLTRSASVDGNDGRSASISSAALQRQMSLPDYHMPTSLSTGHTLEVIPESGFSDNVSDTASPEPASTKVNSPTDSDEMKKSTMSVTSANGGSLRGFLSSMVGSCAMGQPSSRSESEYSDGVSDVDMEDASMMRSGTDGISPDDGSDDYSFMSIGSSDDNASIHMRRKHRPKSLNLSRSVSGTSSEDETSDSAISTDVESKYAGVQPPDPHELRIALAASAFVEEMRGVEAETDDELAEIATHENNHVDKIRCSPSAPVSPSWREGLESPPFSPRRRDSYPGKRRGSSPVSPKDKRFTYTDISPPSRQLSLEELYDKEAHSTNSDPSLVPFAQRPSPKSPDELKDSFYSNSGEVMSFDRPTSSLKKSKPFYSLEDAANDLNDTTTIMDLATYAATVASNTANLTSMSVSPTNIPDSKPGHESPESLGSSSPVSPYYDNVSYKDEHQIDEESEEDIELADPSQKSIDYQGSKRQKARPPTTDWSPVIDLSPILDVSPSLEEAEQAEMLAEQQAERQRQASREDDAYSPANAFIAISEDANEAPDYQYYGLKRYEVVEDISELVKQNNGSSPMSIASNESTEHSNGNISKPEHKTVTDVAAFDAKMPTHPTPIFPLHSNAEHMCAKLHRHDPKCSKSTDNPANPGHSIDTSKKMKPVEAKPESVQIAAVDIPDSASTTQSKTKLRRKLPEPNAEIIATQKAPVPKPRRKDKPSETPPPKPARTAKAEPQEPTRNPPILHQSVFANKQASKSQDKPVLQKQNSEERRRTAKDMKAKPDPLIMSHLELEDASASPQYKVLESPPSPENKSAIRREYSDSTSVSPSSSPDRESFLYPSPVTPPDSDSSPPKPHSPSSGTDFEDEFILVCEDSSYVKPKEKVRNASVPSERRQSTKHNHDRDNHEKNKNHEKDQPSHHAKNKQHSPQSKDHKQKEMKKVRRKLPPIPAEEELNQTAKPKQRPVPPRKPPPRTDNRVFKNKPSASSTSDDSSMNEDDKEVASITRKKQVNNLDKPSIDKRNGNYLKNSNAPTIRKPEDYVEINIPPDLEMLTIKIKDDSISDTYHNETDAIIDSLINIYGAPITQAMKGLKRRLQDELRRVTEGRRRKIDEIEELRVLKFQLGELRIGASNKSNSGSNGKKRSTTNSRTSPQMINRRARHKRQSSDPMVAKFSPIKEDKDIESEIQIVPLDDTRICRTADDSSQSGISDTDSARSEPIIGNITNGKKVKPTDYAKMFYTHHAQSSETLDTSARKAKQPSPQLISSHSDGHIPVDTVEDEETRLREEKRRELQFEIEKRRKQLAEREAKLKEARSSIGATSKQLAQSCDEISSRVSIPSCIHPRPIPTGIIKPIDDEDDNIQTKANFQNQTSYSSTEYLAHKQEEIMRQRLDGLSSFSSPYLYSAEFGEKSAFVPQQTRSNLDSYSYSTGNVNVSRDFGICSSATLPNIPISKADLENNNRPVSDTESSPPHIPTPAMPLLSDVKARSRKIIHEIGTGSRPVSAEFNLGVEDLMNGMYRVESDNSVDADEPIMKHLMEGGVTILKQLERKKQPPPSAPKKYDNSVKRILLTTDPKEKYGKGRPGNGVGMRIVGGKNIPGTSCVGAFVATIFKGGVADQLHGEVNEGDQILEWNGIELTGRSYEEVQQIISQAPNGEVELVIKPSMISKKVMGETTAQAPSCHSSYDNLESDEESEIKRRPAQQQGVDPKQLAATLEEIEEDESPCMSHSSSQQDSNTASASSGCSSPMSEPTSTSSDQKRNKRVIATATACVSSPTHLQRKAVTKSSNNRSRYGSQGQLPTVSHDQSIKSSQSSSEYMYKSHDSPTPPKQQPKPQPRSKPTTSLEPPSYRAACSTPSRSPPKFDKQQSEKSEQKKKELNQQSNSFDDFIRMSQHAGVDGKQMSPSKRPSKRGLSSSASELARRQSEDEIKKSPKGSSRGNRQMGDIQLKLHHDEHNSEFKCHVIQARNLLPMDLNGLSDPFVKLYLLPGRCADNKRRTKHIARTLNPEWNETVVFPDVHIEELRNKTLEVTVWDYDRFKANDFLGEVVIDFSEEAFLDNMPHWYPLCGHEDVKGLDIPQPTVLPPKHSRANSVSPRSVAGDKQSGGGRGERGRPGLGRRRRSFDTLQDVDKV